MNKYPSLGAVLFCALPLCASSQELTAREAVQEALQQNPTLQAALDDLTRAQLAVEIEENRFRANFTAETLYSHQSLSTALAGDITSDTLSLSTGLSRVFPWGTQLGATVLVDTTSQEALDPSYGARLSLSITQPLLQGFGTRIGKASITTAQYNKDASEYAQRQAASELIRDVLTAYWELWYAQEAEKIQQGSLQTIRKQIEDATTRVTFGALAPVELLSLQTEEATIEEELANAQANIRIRSLALAQLLGRSASTSLIASEAQPPSVVLDSEEELLSLAIERSFTLRQLSASIDVAQVSVTLAKDKLRPNMSATGQLQLSQTSEVEPTAIASTTESAPVTGFLGLRLEVPVSWAAKRDEVERATLAVSAAQSRFDAAKAQLTQQLLAQLERYYADTARLTLATKTASLAQASVEAAQTRFDAGITTALDLVRAQQQQREASLRVTRLQVEILLDQLAIHTLTGALLSQ